VATTSLQHLRSNASGEASLVTEEHQNETQSSGDASLVATSLQPWRSYASGEASRVTEEHQNETQTSEDASLVATSLQPWRSYASGEASLVTNIQQKAVQASGDAPLATVSLQCKRQCASGDASLAKTALDSHSQCTGGEDIIICAICQRAIRSNNIPTYLCSQCEQTFHVSCEKGKIIHKTEKSEGPLDDDYVCSSCTQLNQTIPYGNDHSIAESILQEQVDIVQPNCYNSGNNHLQVTATAIVQKQNMVYL
jgi:uncharacterized CHY-type Zn-finger protein